jgi:hypothetical protein
MLMRSFVDASAGASAVVARQFPQLTKERAWARWRIRRKGKDQVTFRARLARWKFVALLKARHCGGPIRRPTDR